MVGLDSLRPPQLVAEALGAGVIPSKFSAILAVHFRTVCGNGTALPPYKRLGLGIHSFLVQLVSGVGHIPGLDMVSLIGVEQDGTVHLFHSLLSVSVDLYCISPRLFACRVELTAKGLHPVVEIPQKSFM